MGVTTYATSTCSRNMKKARLPNLSDSYGSYLNVGLSTSMKHASQQYDDDELNEMKYVDC